MKAIGLTKYLPINNPESLVDLQVATPEPSDRDLLVTTSPHILGSWVDFDTISCIRRSIFIDFGESNGL
jgi:hypothetical protein